MSVGEALDQIEEKHRRRCIKGHAWRGPQKSRCPDKPCDTVKLARALDAILSDDYEDITLSPSREQAYRTLEEVAGG